MLFPWAASVEELSGGIYAGLYNPTPATAIGAFIVFVFGLVRGQLDREGIKDSVLETACTTGMIYLILLSAELLRIFMSRAGIRRPPPNGRRDLACRR
jgi:TRAP-type C4-dicarboxylate transport system permease large subunit